MIKARLVEALRNLRPTSLRLAMPAKTERSPASLHEARAQAPERRLDEHRASFPEHHLVPDETPNRCAGCDPFRLAPEIRVRRIKAQAFHIALADRPAPPATAQDRDDGAP